MIDDREDVTANKLVLIDELSGEEQTPQEVINAARLSAPGVIPVPPSFAEIVDKRFRTGLRVAQEFHKDWEKSIAYFQGAPNTEDDGEEPYPVENLVQSTVETMVDYTYMRNPTIEISALDQRSQEVADVLTAAMTTLITRRAAPGLNLRPKVLKQLIYSHLSNFGVLELDFQEFAGSLNEAQKLFAALEEKIRTAKDAETAAPHYEGLDRLHMELQARLPFGITVKNCSPFSILVDPECQEPDLSDCRWLIKRDTMKTAFIKSEYMTYDESETVYRFRYNPEVVFDERGEHRNQSAVAATTAESIIDQLMPEYAEQQRKAILEDSVPVVRMYDRATRRIYLYMQDRWDTPLWVYEDKLGLSRFYPFFILPFSSPLASVYQRSEVSKYIPFQFEINEGHKQMSIIRRVAFSLFVYDSTRVDGQEIERLFTEATKASRRLRGIGVKMKDQEGDLSKMFAPLLMPSAQAAQLLDNRPYREAVERQSRISEALRGAEFRTNTTNQAIDAYTTFARTRLEGLTDKIEQVVEELLWAVCELVVSKYDRDTIVSLIPPDKAQKFVQMDVAEFNNNYTLQVAAGSTEKPTSANKKQEAATIIQMLGQFGTAAPMTVLGIVSRLLRSAFSRTLVTDEDLKNLQQEGMAALQKGISQGPEQGVPPPAPPHQ